MLGAGNSGARHVTRPRLGHARRALARLNSAAAAPPAAPPPPRPPRRAPTAVAATVDRDCPPAAVALPDADASCAGSYHRVRGRRESTGETSRSAANTRKCPPQRAVSRILFRLRPLRALRRSTRLRRMTIIPLGPALLAGSSGLPGGFGRAVLAPRRSAPPYLALLRAGFCLPPAFHRRGALLPHLFTLTRLRLALPGSAQRQPLLMTKPALTERPKRERTGGIFSVPLSFGLPRPGVTRRTALRSSDFPPSLRPSARLSESDRLARCGGTISMLSMSAFRQLRRLAVRLPA